MCGEEPLRPDSTRRRTEYPKPVIRTIKQRPQPPKIVVITGAGAGVGRATVTVAQRLRRCATVTRSGATGGRRGGGALVWCAGASNPDGRRGCCRGRGGSG
jgi:NADPH:quinone reductase-like Zn-dependent oxidoreductase